LVLKVQLELKVSKANKVKLDVTVKTEKLQKLKWNVTMLRKRQN